ncbi:spore germination protein (amino acid permease) [Ruminiclostridium sufflavum DSM 19573]|uniref:Spore germination protein (Amino acid permease) n=1 Tax=Ruminiclostridium sufflavum DSM 19573 TaxID=1121337 RepID=A0A318XNP4_9FIRM|nr:GerAB/ArcD/ProY family transporter [Ruminiclostridium sufflavum]PYG88531.1 spore germination protein (amino acid permease) [Ruminiclostridium sufflavum DSM 19573]
MKNKIGFGSWEATTLLVNLVFANIMLVFPRDMVQLGGSAGWMIPVIITLIAAGYFAITVKLYNNIGSMDLLDISDCIGGRIFKVIIGLLITIFLILTASIYLGAFSQTLKIISLDRSSLEYVEVLFLAGMTAAAYFGVEAIARISAFLVPAVIIGFLLITVGVIPEFRMNNLFPVMGEGALEILKGSGVRLSVFAMFVILFLMVPFFKKQLLKKVGFSYVLLSGILLIWSTLSFILVFPYEMAADKKIPVFQIARHMDFGNYIQRIESISVLISSICALIFLGAVFNFVIYVFAKTLDLKQSKPLILPMAIIVFSLSIISKRVKFDFLGDSITNIIWLLGMVLPLIIIIIGAAKKVGTEGTRRHK